MIKVLDKGSVELIDYLGNGKTIVSAARMSYGKGANEELTEKDLSDIALWAKQGHNVFRHVVFSFAIKAPLMVRNQWWRYVVSSCHRDEQFAWNEKSFRYTDTLEFYIPDGWPEFDSKVFAHMIEVSVSAYKQAILDGLPKEQARLFLPAYALYTTWIWTASLESVAHFIRQRSDNHAQKEIREYAQAVRKLVEPLFPVALSALLGGA